MNLGIVVTNYDAAEGTGGYAVALVHRLARQHDITLYTSRAHVAPPANARVVRVPAPRAPASLLNLSFPFAFQAIRGRHDVVHAQGWTALSADVVTAHIVFAAWRAAWRAAGERPAGAEGVLGGVIEAGERRLMQRGARHIIVPSARAQTDIARWYGRRDGVTVMHHGFPAVQPLPDPVATRAAFGIPADGFTALYAGDARKGLMAAIEATALAGTRLIVASRSQPGRYLARAAALKVGDRVHWLGAQPGLRGPLAAADVLLHPTLYDSFGLVVAEAMAAGVPPIVTRHAGASELIAHRASGWLLGDDPARDAAQALTTLAGDASLRATIGAGAKAVAARRTWDDVARETAALYSTLHA